MGGRVSRGWVIVAPVVLEDDSSLREWLDRGVETARAAVSPQP